MSIPKYFLRIDFSNSADPTATCMFEVTQAGREIAFATIPVHDFTVALNLGSHHQLPTCHL
jgi:hypothetical protein